MKKTTTLTFIFALFISLQLPAQLRSNLSTTPDYSSSVINTKASTVQSGLNEFFNNKVTMSHSYSMNFGSVGGSFQNINAYTNTLQFDLTPKLDGRVDVSFLHSPFGQSNFSNTDNGLGGEVIIRNAELNYKINDNAHISLQYQQLPRSFGFYNPYGYNRMGSWY
ncbi:MAG: hypothetical protein WD059_05355 [Balneolaceae bacterium]